MVERYSFSKLSSFHTCPYGYYQRYIKGLKGEGNAFSSYGTLVHSILERWAKNEIPMDILADMFEWEFPIEVPEKFPYNKYVDLRESYFNQAVSYLKNFNGFPGLKILGVEERFDVYVDDWIFNGVIDLVGEKNGELIIIDHKSHKKFASKDEQHQYTRQLYLYSLHIKEKYGEYPGQLMFNMFRNPAEVYAMFDEQNLDEALQWARGTVKEIRECFDFYPTPNDFFCRNLCNHRKYCTEKK